MNDKNSTSIAILFIALTIAFIFHNLSFVNELFQVSTPFGSDMGSHFFATKYLKNELLPKLTIFGWDQGSHGGYPIFQFYHPLPFIIIALFSFLIPIEIAFKLIIIAAVFAIPVAMFLAVRILTKNNLLAALGMMLSLLSLYHKEHEIYGGNLSSIFAGEFCFALANGILLIYLACLFKGIKENRLIVVNIILLATLPMTHLVSFIVGLFAALFFLFTKPLKQNFIYLTKLHLSAFLLSAFWTVPMFFKKDFAKEMISKADWWHDFVEIFHLFPRTLIPCYIIILVFFIYQLLKKEKVRMDLIFILFAMLVSSIFFVHSIFGWPSRFHPITGMLAILLSTLIIGEIIKSKKILAINISYISILVAVVIITSKVDNLNKAYAQYVLKGMEATPGYNDFIKLHKYFDQHIGNFRVVAQKDKKRSKAVTDRSFEYTPYISKAITLEGLYGAGSLGYIFEKILNGSFVKEAQISETLYQEFLEYNVGWVITVKKESKVALLNNSDYEHVYNLGIYDIFKFIKNKDSYVKVLNSEVFNLNQPIKEWKSSAADWFRHLDKRKYYFTYNGSDRHQDLKEIPEDYKLQNLVNCINNEKMTSQTFSFQTKCLNKPHIIKISYFPDWKVKGAKKIYLVSPGFMLIYPTAEKVEFYYDKTNLNVIANVLSIAGSLVLLFFIFKPLKTKESQGNIIFYRSLTIVALSYIFIISPNIHYRWQIYLPNLLKLKNAKFTFIENNYLKTKEILNTINYKGFEDEKDYLLSKVYYFTKEYKSMPELVFRYVSKSRDQDKRAEIRYYFALSKMKEKLYEHLMHEAYMLDNEHRNSIWQKRFDSEFELWKTNNPQIYEKYKEFYK